MQPAFAPSGAMSYSYPSPYGPGPAQGAYMPMQYPAAAPAARGPWPMSYQPAAAGMYPMYPPFGAMPYGMVPVASLQPAPVFFDGKVKSAGGTLVQWYVRPPRAERPSHN